MQLKFAKPRKRKKQSRIDKFGSERLVGKKDHFMRRMELFNRAGGRASFNLVWYTVDTLRPAICELCGDVALDWDSGHWIHDANKTPGHRRHCDGMCCCVFGCIGCHRKLHPDGRLG